MTEHHHATTVTIIVHSGNGDEQGLQGHLGVADDGVGVIAVGVFVLGTGISRAVVRANAHKVGTCRFAAQDSLIIDICTPPKLSVLTHM